MADKGIFGKIMDHVTPDDDDNKNQKDDQKKGGGGLLGKIKDRFDGDDDEPAKQPAPASVEHQQSSSIGSQSAWTPSTSTSTSAPSESSAAASAPADTWASNPYAHPPTAGGAGSVSGSGKERVYLSRQGDTLESIAAFFYGDPVHRQRLLDDNPELSSIGSPLPGGIAIRVGEDIERGDAVQNSGY